LMVSLPDACFDASGRPALWRTPSQTTPIRTMVSASPNGLLKWRASGRLVMPGRTFLLGHHKPSFKEGRTPFFFSAARFSSLFSTVFHLKTVIS
jgi:hypothetical protein